MIAADSQFQINRVVAMVEAKAQIPIVWKTTTAVADRLLGKAGRPLLERTLEFASQLAAERQWPLTGIKVTHYEDPEIVWEYLLLVLVFDCGPVKAERLWDEFLNATEIIERELNEQDYDLFIRAICYEFECSP